MALLKREEGLLIGDNEPYSVSDASDYTIPVHGERRGLLHVEVNSSRPDRRRQWAASVGRAPSAIAPAGISGTNANRRDGTRVNSKPWRCGAAIRPYFRSAYGRVTLPRMPGYLSDRLGANRLWDSTPLGFMLKTASLRRRTSAKAISPLPSTKRSGAVIARVLCPPQ